MLLRRNLWDIVVIGGGIAGLSAAWYSARRGLATALFEPQISFGGQVATVNAMDDWPGSRPSGVDVATAMVEQARALDVHLIHERVSGIVVDSDPLVVKSEKTTLRTRRIIIASGARLRTLGVPGEEALRGKGVSQCAHCDSHFFRDQEVVVIGGGDAALQEALVLADSCSGVTIVSRSILRARRAYVNSVTGSPVIRFVWDAAVEEIFGADAVTGVRLRNLKTGAPMDIACSGVFPFIGVEPETGFLPQAIARSSSGHVVTDCELHTQVPTVFAIGAARSGYFGQLVNAMSDAATVTAVISRELAA